MNCAETLNSGGILPASCASLLSVTARGDVNEMLEDEGYKILWNRGLMKCRGRVSGMMGQG